MRVSVSILNAVGVCLGLFLVSTAKSDTLDISYTTLDMPGAQHTEAYGIDGGNIIGTYYNDGGRHHGFIAVIPEPATLPLLALGMLVAWRRRRRCGVTALTSATPHKLVVQ